MDGGIEKMSVSELRRELEQRNEDTRGTKAVLQERLREVLKEEALSKEDGHVEAEAKLENVITEDAGSVGKSEGGKSRTSVASSSRKSATSSASSARKIEAAKAAGLKAKAAALQKKYKLEQEELRLKQEKEQLELEADLAECMAREEALACDDDMDGTRYKERNVKPTSMHNEKKPEENEEKKPEENEEKKPELRVTEHENKQHKKSHVSRRKEENNTPKKTSPGQSAMMSESMLAMRRLHLPALDLETFSGDSASFKPFMRTFQMNIAANLECEEEKLLYLLKFTSGKAHDIVSTCVHLPQGQGYGEAVRLLTKRFSGHTQAVGGLVERMLEHSSIRADDTEGLDDFSIFLRGCLNAVQSMPHGMATVDSKTIRQLVEKLPYHMVDKWRRLADTLEQEQERMASFSDFVQFVEKEARIAANPTYGRHLLSTTSKKEPKSAETASRNQGSSRKDVRQQPLKERRARTLASSVREQNKCLFCHEDTHELELCQQFESQTEDEKKQFVMKNGLCFACLKRESHISRDCKQRKKCKKCERWHPTSMHRHTSAPVVKTGHINQKKENGGGKLQMLHVTAQFMGRKTRTGAFIDGGSTHSFVSKRLMDELGVVPHRKSTVIISTVSGENSMVTELVTGLCIDSTEGGHKIELPALYVLPEIPVNREDLVTQEDINKWPHLREVIRVEKTSRTAGLLIGANAAVVSEPLEVINSPSQDEPYAVRSRYGWMVCGIGNDQKSRGRLRVNRMKISTVIEAAEVEDFGNSADCRRGLSVEDAQWCMKVEASCTRVDGKYQIALPFRGETPDLRNNYELAEGRLNALKRKFTRDPEYAESYRAEMKKLLDAGHAEEAPSHMQDGTRSERGHWFLPHHGVVHPTKPGKLRLVYDCAAKYDDLSLNDTLLQGPNLSNLLWDVLLRFRQEPVAFSGDIEAMFLQVMVPENQRNYLKFLWWPDGDTSQPIKEYRMTRHLFGATSSPSCANYALHRTAEDFGDDFEPAVKSSLRKDMYVDDILKTTVSDDAAVALALDLKRLCLMGGFNLTKFCSNSVEFLEALPKEDRAKSMKDLALGQDPLPAERVLGVLWDPEADRLGFALDIDALKRKPVTRRGILSATAACYDPLGLATPYIVKGRMLMQELTRLRLGWDEPVPAEVKTDWIRWLAGLQQLKEVKVPRCLTPSGLSAASRVELHHFADASEKGYGTATYMRTISMDGEVHCSLMTSRARVTPIKSVSIPRLELTAAKLAVEVNLEVTRALDLKVDQVVYWTDSTSTLKYINNETTRYNVFVANRLTVIHDGSDKEQWRYVPSTLNVADMVSRGTLQDIEVWKHGPSFLWRTSEHWPKTPELGRVPADDPEVKVVRSTSTAVVMREDVSGDAEEAPMDKLIRHHSSWRGLTRSVAWLRRAIRVLRCKTQGKDVEKSDVLELTVAEIRDAELCVVKYVQEVSFAQDLKELAEGRHVRVNSRLARLNPFVDREGLLRVGGRLQNSTLSWEAKHPLILPDKGAVVDMIIMCVHQKVGHEGRQHVLAELGTRFWIVKMNSAVRRCLKACVSCRRRQRPMEAQLMANLPEDRVHESEHPFQNTGVDYFGNFYVKRGRKLVKKYGVIFCCLNVRAVHLEVADSLSTDSFLCALRRFTSRRGNVRLMRSDRGTNFVGAERELAREVKALLGDESKLKRAMLTMGIDWRFNTAGASHHGGAWERLIRSVRKILNALLQSQSFTDETLHTYLCEVECILNNRPLIPVSSDPRDDLPITPNHILHLSCVMPVGDTPRESDLNGRRSWKQAAYLADQFWRRWRSQYLPLLQTRPGPNTRSRANVKVGDIVVLVDDSVPRGVWPLGRVEETYPGGDGKVRSVKIRARGTTFLRPITKIVKIVTTDTQ